MCWIRDQCCCFFFNRSHLNKWLLILRLALMANFTLWRRVVWKKFFFFHYQSMRLEMDYFGIMPNWFLAILKHVTFGTKPFNLRLKNFWLLIFWFVDCSCYKWWYNLHRNQCWINIKCDFFFSNCINVLKSAMDIFSRLRKNECYCFG